MSAQLGVTPGGVELATSPSGGSGGGGGAPSGPAGGSLAGTYPNPSLAAGAVGTGQLAANAVTAAKIATGAVGPAALADTAVTPGSYTNMSATVDQDGRLTAASSGTAVTSVTGTAPITSSGGTTPAIGLNNTGTTPGRAGERILIDDHALAAATTYTSPSWSAGKYQEIIVYFKGQISTFAFMGFRANNDSTVANYIDLGINITSAVVADSTDGTNGFARTAVDVTGGIKMVDEIHFFPLTDGRERTGWSIGSAMGSTTLASNTKRDVSFAWRDKVTDVTFITYLLSTAATMTGNIQVWGVPA